MKRKKLIVLSIIGLCVACKLSTKSLAERKMEGILGTTPFEGNVNLNYLKEDVFYLPSDSWDEDGSPLITWSSSNPEILSLNEKEVKINNHKDPNDYKSPVILEASLRYPDIPIIGSKTSREFLVTVVPSSQTISEEDIEKVNPYDETEFENYGRDMTVVFDEEGNAEKFYGDFKNLSIQNEKDALEVAEAYRNMQDISAEYEFRINGIQAERYKGDDRCFTTYYIDILYKGIPVIEKGIVLETIDWELKSMVFHRINEVRGKDVPAEYEFSQETLTASMEKVITELGYENSVIINKEDYSLDALQELYIKNIYDESEAPLFSMVKKFYDNGTPVLYVYNNRDGEYIRINLLDDSFECVSAIFGYEESSESWDDLIKKDWHFIPRFGLNNLSTAESESGEKLQFESCYDGYLQLHSGFKGLFTKDKFNIRTYHISDGFSLFDELVPPHSDMKRHFEDSISAEAYCYALNAANWYKNTFGRLSYDGEGGSLNIYTNYAKGENCEDNAFWNEEHKSIYITPKVNGEYTKAEQPEVIAHEFTHGICNHYMDFTGSGSSSLYLQSINETYADIFACFMYDKDEWMVGYSKNIYHKDDGTIYVTTGYDRDLTLENQDKLKRNSDGSMKNPFPRTFSEFEYATKDTSVHMHRNGVMLSNIAYQMYKSDLFTKDECRWIWYNSLRYGFPAYSNYGTVRENVIMAMEGLGCSREQKEFVSSLFDEKEIYGSKTMEQHYSPYVKTANIALNKKIQNLYAIALPDIKDKGNINVYMFSNEDDFTYEERIELGIQLEQAIQKKTDEMGLGIKVNFAYSYKNSFLCGLAERFCKDLPGKFSIDRFIDMQSSAMADDFSKNINFGFHFHTSLYNICDELGMIEFEKMEEGEIFHFSSTLKERCVKIAEEI